MNPNDKNLVEALFSDGGLSIAHARRGPFENFVGDAATQALLEEIRAFQKQLMEKWEISERISAVERQQVMLPNGTAGKPYEAVLDLAKWGWGDLQDTRLEGFEAIGLGLEIESGRISGIPQQSGDAQLHFYFRVPGESADTALHQRPIYLIINPDPRTLWKDIAADENDPYYKENEESVVARLGERTLIAASKRGRSHANTGGFREDHFTWRHSPESGWSLVALSDGAGSARLSRKGSAIACASVADWFDTNFGTDVSAQFEQDIASAEAGGDEAVQKRMSAFIYSTLQAAAWKAHKDLEAFAAETGASLRDLHCTLVFTLFKKTEAGYVFLSFGVGDCPVALLSKEAESVSLLSTLDVGEFSGGTRFLTMPEIFAADSFPSRINYKLVDDFGFLVLMTDGIYDPKFGVEAALERPAQWKDLLADLGGNNEEGNRVELAEGNAEGGAQLLRWMDFWSPGNHDDRTLAIVF
jgi:serine/threonine protein phosphatase PrpC